MTVMSSDFASPMTYPCNVKAGGSPGVGVEINGYINPFVDQTSNVAGQLQIDVISSTFTSPTGEISGADSDVTRGALATPTLRGA